MSYLAKSGLLFLILGTTTDLHSLCKETSKPIVKDEGGGQDQNFEWRVQAQPSGSVLITPTTEDFKLPVGENGRHNPTARFEALGAIRRKLISMGVPREQMVIQPSSKKPDGQGYIPACGLWLNNALDNANSNAGANTYSADMSLEQVTTRFLNAGGDVQVLEKYSKLPTAALVAVLKQEIGKLSGGTSTVQAETAPLATPETTGIQPVAEEAVPF